MRLWKIGLPRGPNCRSIWTRRWGVFGKEPAMGKWLAVLGVTVALGLGGFTAVQAQSSGAGSSNAPMCEVGGGDCCGQCE